MDALSSFHALSTEAQASGQVSSPKKKRHLKKVIMDRREERILKSRNDLVNTALATLLAMVSADLGALPSYNRQRVDAKGQVLGEGDYDQLNLAMSDVQAL